MGAGFLGREVAHQAGAGGWKVVPVVRTERSAEGLRQQFEETVATDATSSSFWAELQGQWSGLVWAMAPSRESVGGDFQSMHREGAVRAAQWARERRVAMVYLSSTSVYEEADGGWVDEGSALAQDERSAAMVYAEMETVRAGGSVLRCAGFYGGERELRDRAEGPERWLNVVHREDAARAVGVALRNQGQTFNVAENFPLRRGVAGGVWAEGSKRTRRSKRVSNAKLRNEGWAPIYRAGVKDSSHR